MSVHDRNYKAGIDPSLYTFTQKQMNDMSGEGDSWENTDKPKWEMVSGPVKPLTNGVNGSNGVTPMYAELLDETVERPQVPVANGVNGGDGVKPMWEGYERYANWGKEEALQTPQAPLLRGDVGVNGSNGVTVAKPSPKHVTDWSNGFAQGIANGAAKEKPLWEVMQDYDRWAKENNGEVLDSVSKYVLFNQYDPTKSIAQNEEEERHRKSQAKWEQIGNLFSHLGNFVGGMVGAPPQPLESGEALTERQRKIRDAVQAQRRQTANDMLSLWYKDIADKRAAELNAANIAYRNQQKVYLGNKEQREKDASDALVRQRDSSTAYNQAKTTTEDSMRPLKEGTERGKQAVQASQVSKNNRTGGGRSGGRRSGGTDNRETVSVTTKSGTTTERRTWKQEHKNSKGRPYGQSKGKGY